MFIANFLPDTNYTRDLTVSLKRVVDSRDEIFLCGRKNEPVLDNYVPHVDEVWARGFFFFIPIFRYIRSKKPDIIHIQHEFKTYGGIGSAVVLPICIGLLRLFGYVIVVTFHGVVSPHQLDKNFLESFGVKYSWLMKWMVALVFRYIYTSISIFSNAITVHTSFLQSILVDAYGLRGDRIHVIAHGVREIEKVKISTSSARILQKYPLLRKKNIITVFGYFSPRKGYEFLLNAFCALRRIDRSYDSWVLVLAGDVTSEYEYYKTRIVDQITKLKLQKNVLITGFVDKKDIDELYRLTRIVLIPAVYSFNTSGALSIALAYKKPILVADVKPLADEIRQNKFGFLYDSHDPSSCVKQLRKLIDNRSVYVEAERSLLRSVKYRYWSKIARAHYKLYRQLIYNL